MLKLKDPISLKSARPLLSLSEGFAECSIVRVETQNSNGAT